MQYQLVHECVLFNTCFKCFPNVRVKAVDQWIKRQLLMCATLMLPVPSDSTRVKKKLQRLVTSHREGRVLVF